MVKYLIIIVISIYLSKYLEMSKFFKHLLASIYKESRMESLHFFLGGGSIYLISPQINKTEFLKVKYFNQHELTSQQKSFVENLQISISFFNKITQL